MINVVHNSDCLPAMKEMQDNEFDLAIVDIEYNIGASRPSKKPELVKQKNGELLRVISNNYKHKNWDDKLSSDEYLIELFRVTNNQIVFGGNYYGLKGGYIVWDKINGESDQFGCELAYQSFNKRTDIIRYMWQGMFQGVYCGKNIKKAQIQQGNKKLNEKRIHPTQKPIALYKWLLNNYAKPNDTILDTHVGSGSSRIACWEMGYDFTGYEIDKDYWEAQEKRFSVVKNQMRIFI